MRLALPATVLTAIMIGLAGCAQSEPVPAEADDIEAAVNQANEAAGVARDETTEDIRDAL